MHDDRIIVWITLLGAIVLGALVSFFNTLFRLPLNNKEKIDRLEVKIEYAMRTIEQEQKMNKESHQAILSKLGMIEKQINRLSVKLAKQEGKNEVDK